jgi:DNA-binding protein H-NS
VAITKVLEELLRERIALQSRIEQLDEQARTSAISQAKKIIADFSLEPYDLFDEISVKVQPKYRNPETGEQWSGRGKTPRWLAGKDREKYRIK